MPAFEDDEKTIKSKVGVKAAATKSMFDNAPRPPSKEASEKRAAEINERLNSYPERTTELVPLFIKLLNSKVLPQNKSVLDDDIERDVINRLMQLGLDMDGDQYEQNGAGSVGLTVLLMKCLLIQRDKINDLDYKLGQFELEIKSLKSKILQVAIDNKSNSE